jgi:DNA topoisomerase-1
MAAAIYDTISVNVTGKTPKHRYQLRASGSTIRFPGFLVVYKEAKDEDENGNNGEMLIPTDLKENQRLDLIRLIPNQHFTQPPARYTDASLVRALEENGIGRPSTYAPILSTLRKRGYVVRQDRRLVPTEIGTIVNDLLTDHFPNIVDVGFTAKMESELDRVATGEMSWVDVVREFYEPFEEQIERAKLEMPEVDAGPEPIGRECPECGNDLVLRWGRHGKFIGCSNFPNCRYTEPWLEKIGVKCPKDGGELVERKTRRGRTFYGCSNYPKCDFSSWKRPIAIPCPNCGGLLAVANKTHAQCQDCELKFNFEDLDKSPEKA